MKNNNKTITQHDPNTFVLSFLFELLDFLDLVRLQNYH